MALTAAELVKADQEHLIHPLHHPSENAEPVIYVRGRGATVWDIGGHEYIDGLSGLWNVNVGHGRAELAEAAAAQMKELAYFTAYVGSSNIPAITLADRLMEITYDNMQAVFLASGGAEANESAFKTARFYWKAGGKPDGALVRARTLEREARHPLVRQGRHVGLPAARRDHGQQGDQAGDGLGEAREPLDARVHLLGSPDVLRGRGEEPRDHDARAPLGERGEDGRASARQAHGRVP